MKELKLEPHIEMQLQRIYRVAQHLPRGDLEKFILTLAQNFLEREDVYVKWIESLKKKLKDNV